MGANHQRPTLGARLTAGETPNVHADRDVQTVVSDQPRPVIVEMKRPRALRRTGSAKPSDQVVTNRTPSSSLVLFVAPRLPIKLRPDTVTLTPHERQKELLCAAEEQRMATMADKRRRSRADHASAARAKREHGPKRVHNLTPPTMPVVEAAALDPLDAARSTETPPTTLVPIKPQAEPRVELVPELQSPVGKQRFTKRDVAWRLSGVALFAAAAGSSLVHRHILSLEAHHAATTLEMGLGLTSFILASLGVLLVMHGAGLREKWTPDDGIRSRSKPATGLWGGHAGDPEHADHATFESGREAIGAMLAYRRHDRIARASHLKARPH